MHLRKSWEKKEKAKSKVRDKETHRAEGKTKREVPVITPAHLPQLPLTSSAPAGSRSVLPRLVPTRARTVDPI